MLDIWNALKDVISLLSTTMTVFGAIKLFQHSNIRQELANTKADLALKMRGHIAPVIIERLDDGTNPQYQHFAFEERLLFPQERIDKSIYYRNSQTIENVLRVIGEHICAQAWKDAEYGEERATMVILDFQMGLIRSIYELHGHVGVDWEVISEHMDINIRRYIAQFPTILREQEEWRKEAKARRKAEKK